MARPLVALGFMSGTSMDGIDAAIIETDGEQIERFGPTYSSVFTPDQHGILMRAIEVARGLSDRDARPGVLAEAEAFITQAHSEVALALMAREGLGPRDIDIIGFHGQTVFHKPEDALTVQIGDGQLLAQFTGIDVVSDFRAADMVAGGQGAPLAPVFHGALQRHFFGNQSCVFVNVGGISNVTWISPSGELIAFDTGPGNVLLDAWVQRHLQQSFDRDGALSLSGKVDEGVLAALLENPYFTKAPPKSLDKTNFKLSSVEALNVADGAATLAAFTAETLARASQHMPDAPQRWIICGGGRLNKAIMRELEQRISASVVSAEQAGFSGDDVEAQAFGYMAVRVLHGLPLTFPGTTGVAAPTPGGIVHRVRKAA